MATIKGTDVVNLRKIISAQGADEKLRSLLSPELYFIYSHILNISKTPVEIQAKIYEAAAEALFPKDAAGMYKLFLKVAEKTYSGIYRIFLAIPTPQFVMARSANVWRQFYDQGLCTVEKVSEQHLRLKVREFPKLPLAMKIATTAHITVIMQLAGAKNSTISLIEDIPDELNWDILWN